METLSDDDDVSLPSSVVTLPTSPLSMSMGGSISINGLAVQLPDPDALSDSDKTCRSVDDLLEFGVAAEQSHDIECPLELNGFDNFEESDSDEGCTIECEPLYFVPSPNVAIHLSGTHDIAEYYSQRRVLGIASKYNLFGSLSLDILTGWDFNLESRRQLSIALLPQLKIGFLMLSPPCTIFSTLQSVFNFKRWTKEYIQMRMDEGITHVHHSMQCALVQISRGALFCYEHPAYATSWDLEEVNVIITTVIIIIIIIIDILQS